MALSRLWRWFPGWVRVETEGGYPERLLNAVAQEEIAVWNVRCRGEWMRFSCFVRDYRTLRPRARRACVRMRVRQKHGLPFWIHRYRHRKGLLVGLAVYVLILALLAPRIWVVQVVGNTDTSAEEILAVAEDMGVRIGARMDKLQIKQLEIMGLNRLPTLAWISVNPSGSVARVEVTERKPTPQVLDLSVPSDIVALRDGRVVSVTVVSGEKRVKVGEAVSAGTVLIGGRVESELGEQLYRAYGEVLAQTERRITVSVPLTYYPSVPDGFVSVCPTLTFLGWEIPLYANVAPPESHQLYERAHFLQANGLTLPLGITTRYYLRTEQRPMQRTEAQAVELAAARLAAREKELFEADSFEEIGRSEQVIDGVYTLSVQYRCVENIAVEQPLM
ncbi:MAG: sporulation protein YqfD [Clostridia bacterium]|nr:sporulation protein YqfD [Clostridia bacterium]